METDPNQEIIKRLDTMVYLLLELNDKDHKMPIKEKVRMLNEAGLDYNQIAKVLGKSPGNVAVQLTLLKKKELVKNKQSPKDEIVTDHQGLENKEGQNNG